MFPADLKQTKASYLNCSDVNQTILVSEKPDYLQATFAIRGGYIPVIPANGKIRK